MAKILHLNLKKKYFDAIVSGEKKEEYRLVNEFWVKRLINKNYDYIEFKNGYSKNAPKIKALYLGFYCKEINHEFFGNDLFNDNKISVFAIKFKLI